MFKVNPYLQPHTISVSSHDHTTIPHHHTKQLSFSHSINIESHSSYDLSDSKHLIDSYNHICTRTLDLQEPESSASNKYTNIFYSSGTSHKENISYLSGIEDMIEDDSCYKPTDETYRDKYGIKVRQLRQDINQTLNLITDITMTNKHLCTRLKDQQQTIKDLKSYCISLNTSFHTQISELKQKYQDSTPNLNPNSKSHSKHKCCQIV